MSNLKNTLRANSKIGVLYEEHNIKHLNNNINELNNNDSITNKNFLREMNEKIYETDEIKSKKYEAIPHYAFTKNNLGNKCISSFVNKENLNNGKLVDIKNYQSSLKIEKPEPLQINISKMDTINIQPDIKKEVQLYKKNNNYIYIVLTIVFIGIIIGAFLLYYFINKENKNIDKIMFYRYDSN